MTPIKAAADPSGEALKPCPICQSRLVSLFERQEGLFIVSCENDDCIFGVETHGHSANEAVLRWNTRAAPAGNAGVRRIEGATDIVDEAACLIWAELCPGLVMGDTDRQHYENAAKAVLALPQPPETFADEIKRADAAPPEASFDNASDMLGYLNAPREAEPVAWQWRESVGSDWGDWFCLNIPIEQFKQEEKHNLEDDLYEVRPLYASPSPIPEAPVGRERAYCDPVEQGKAFYLAMYENEGANWDANENQEVWVKLARDYERRRRALKPQDGGESGS